MTVIIGIVIPVLCLVTVVLALHIVFKAHSRTLETLDSIHTRQSTQLDSTLDRLMTIRWEDLLALRSLDDAEEGGFISPSDQRPDDEELADDEKGRWGHLRRLRFPSADLTDSERELLDEDFSVASED